MLNARVNFDRARLLLQQRRYADAERELRQTLASDPHFAEAHALLAETLLQLQRSDEAAVEVTLAVREDPQMELGHFVMARVLMEHNRHEEAEQACLRAIELIPYPRSFGVLAAIRFDRRNWAGALQAADEGLSVDPEDSGCLNLRAMALRQLDRHEEADRTLAGALEKDPDDSYAHANRGWSDLHQGRHREAMVHFKEALRLDPTNDHARAGLVEAMKARYFFYRILLGYFLWMGRLQQSAQVAIILGGWVGYQVVRGIARNNPQLAWVTTPLIVAYVAFAWMTWLAAPLMNLTLRLHPIGKHALSTEQRRTANVVGLLILAAATTFAIGYLTPVGSLNGLALFLAIAALPGSLIFTASAGWPRLVLAGMTVTVIGVGLIGELADRGLVPAPIEKTVLALTIPVLLACVFGSQFVAAVRVKR